GAGALRRPGRRAIGAGAGGRLLPRPGAGGPPARRRRLRPAAPARGLPQAPGRVGTAQIEVGIVSVPSPSLRLDTPRPIAYVPHPGSLRGRSPDMARTRGAGRWAVGLVVLLAG